MNSGLVYGDIVKVKDRVLCYAWECGGLLFLGADLPMFRRIGQDSEEWRKNDYGIRSYDPCDATLIGRATGDYSIELLKTPKPVQIGQAVAA